jgi:hypothetical protein
MVEHILKKSSVFDGVFSIARMSCGKVEGEYIASIQNWIHAAMKWRRGLGISFKLPKIVWPRNL